MLQVCDHSWRAGSGRFPSIQADGCCSMMAVAFRLQLHIYSLAPARHEQPTAVVWRCDCMCGNNVCLLDFMKPAVPIGNAVSHGHV